MTLADPQMPVAHKGPWLPRLIASRRFQSWAARFPLTRRIARKDGEKLFDLVSGFVYSQVLLAVVELRLLPTLMAGPLSAADLAKGTDLTAGPYENPLRCRRGIGPNDEKSARFIVRVVWVRRCRVCPG